MNPDVPCALHGRYACPVCYTTPPVWSVPSSSPGWQCPSCGRCYSPFIPMCNFCGPKVEMTTEIHT